MTSFVEQTVQNLTLFVEYAWSLPYAEGTNRTNLETLSALVAVFDEMHKCINYSIHRRQKAFVLQLVVERACADVRSGYMWTDGIEGDVLFWQILAVRSNEPYRTT